MENGSYMDLMILIRMEAIIIGRAFLDSILVWPPLLFHGLVERKLQSL